MTIKFETDYSTVERRNRIVECDFDTCFKTDKENTIFRVPIIPMDSEGQGNLHICDECLATYFSSESFDYVDEVGKKRGGGIQFRLIEEKQVPRSVGLVIAGIPLTGVLLTIGLYAFVLNPGPAGWLAIILISGILYAAMATMIAKTKYGLGDSGVVKKEIKR